MNESSKILSLEPGPWKGDDGNWTSFSICVSDTSGPFNLLPATGGSQIWLPDPLQACAGYTISDCTGTRGVPNGTALTTISGWQHLHLSEMNANPPLFPTFNGDFWLGSVQWTSSTGAKLRLSDERYPIGSYTDQQYWLGLLGIGNDRTTFDTNTTVSGPLQALKESGNIGSLSFGYTAGASYLGDFGEPGSLTLGGYDGARFQAENAINATIVDRARKLQLRVTDLSVSGGKQGGKMTLLTPDEASDGLSVLLDSSTAQLWLPADICQLFAEAFGLIYLGAASNLYRIDDDARTLLHNNHANLTFTIGVDNNANASTTIVLPFKSYDLGLGPPYIDHSISYFPLRNATPDSGNILGRVFLQEAYIIVDWESNVFNVSRTTHAVQTPRLVAIDAIGTTSSASTSLKEGEVAGIVVTCLVLFFASIALTWWIRRRRSRERERKASIEAATIGTVETVETGWDKAELMATESKKERFLELDFLRGKEADSTQLLEMCGSGPERELMSNELLEMEGDLVQRDVKKQADAEDTSKTDGDEETQDQVGDGARSVHELEG